jgi:ribosomal protein S18 acetylase RimI-like enzyme
MAQISAACFQEPAERARQFLARALGLETRAQYLALLDGAPVAIGGVGIEADEATIYGIGVSPDMQGRGIGRGVVALLLRRLLSTSDNDVLIEVDSANAALLHLYLACGFTKESTSGYYRIRADRLAADRNSGGNDLWQYDIRALSPGLGTVFTDYLRRARLCKHAALGVVVSAAYYHTVCRAEDWMARSLETNRSEALREIEGGPLARYLAFEDGACVGWCNANDIANFPAHLPGRGGAMPRQARRLHNLLCHPIPDTAERACTQLLARAIADFRSEGYDAMLALPFEIAGRRRSVAIAAR